MTNFSNRYPAEGHLVHQPIARLLGSIGKILALVAAALLIGGVGIALNQGANIGQIVLGMMATVGLVMLMVGCSFLLESVSGGFKAQKYPSQKSVVQGVMTNAVVTLRQKGHLRLVYNKDQT